ncbi:MAG: O-antigen ligase family protein [Wenzhouxiangellaceae bacterium]
MSEPGPVEPGSVEPRGGVLVDADSVLGQVVRLILFLGLALGLVVPKVAGGAFLLLALIAIIWLEPGFLRRKTHLDRHERLLLLAVSLFVGVWLLAWAGHGFGPTGLEDAGRILRLLLIIPLVMFLSRVDGLEQGWWSGLTAGAALAGIYALWFALAGQQGEWAERVGGPTNPIYFGGVVLAFSLMLLPRVADAALAWPLRLLAGLAVALGLAASALSGSRGAWIALLPLLLLYWFTLGTRQSRRWQLGLPLAIVVFALLLAFLPGVPIGQRLAEGFSAIGSLTDEISPYDTFAIRLAMWQVALDTVSGNWWTGTGPAGFRSALEEAVASGALQPWFLEYHHPHNQYLSALVIAGIPGLISLLLLFGVPAWRFIQLWHTGLERARLIGWSGLVAVTVLAVMALTESIFQRNSGIVWLALLMATSFALVRVQQRREIANRPARMHSLSVIMICRDEADRIEAALRSVAGWADEIVVLDSGSTDGTVEICRRHTDKVEVTDWPGFGRQKQRALERASGDWVLSLDADEAVSKQLKGEIDLVLSRRRPHYCGYRLPWRTLAFGRELVFGHWARAPLRLVRRDRARFTDVQVHEKLLVDDGRARTGRLEGGLLHRVFRDETHAREKLAGYARLQAAERHAAGRRATRVGAWFRAAFNLLDNCLLRMALLDGRAGWRMSWLHAEYTLLKYRELARLSGRELGDRR